jgi:hypothetical protein
MAAAAPPPPSWMTKAHGVVQWKAGKHIFVCYQCPRTKKKFKTQTNFVKHCEQEADHVCPNFAGGLEPMGPEPTDVQIEGMISEEERSIPTGVGLVFLLYFLSSLLPVAWLSLSLSSSHNSFAHLLSKFHRCPLDAHAEATCTSFCPVAINSLLIEAQATCTRTYRAEMPAVTQVGIIEDRAAQRDAARATALPLILEHWKHGPATAKPCNFLYSKRTDLAVHLELEHGFAGREHFLVPNAQVHTFITLIHRYLCVEFNRSNCPSTYRMITNLLPLDVHVTVDCRTTLIRIGRYTCGQHTRAFGCISVRI